MHDFLEKNINLSSKILIQGVADIYSIQGAADFCSHTNHEKIGSLLNDTTFPINEREKVGRMILILKSCFTTFNYPSYIDVVTNLIEVPQTVDPTISSTKIVKIEHLICKQTLNLDDTKLFYAVKEIFLEDPKKII